MTLRELREKRGKVVTDMRAIHDKAEKENREFTAEERTAFDKLKGEKESLNVKISDREAVDDDERRSPGRPLPGQAAAVDDGELRILAPNETVAALFPTEERAINLDRVVRGMVGGGW